MNRAMRATAEQLIAALRLEPLPHEGGFFRQTWRSETSSSILFLLTRESFSALHRLDRDEVWHFCGGHPVELVQLGPDGGVARETRLGPDVLAGEQPQWVVPAGCWQGARLAVRSTGPDDHALLGCTVSPPWEERAFSLGRREELLREFPAQAAWVHALTR